MSPVEETYREFAADQAHLSSPIYERLALAVADDQGARAFLEALPRSKRQPNLLFAAMRWFDVPVESPAIALDWLSRHHDDVRSVVLSRMTQTNEVARCATLLPALALLREPLALIEVGASAGLCLLYDGWQYHYRGDGIDHHIGDPHSPVVLTCDVSGAVPLPQAVPSIAWRLGLDLNPIDVIDADARRWLQTLVWPEHEDRAQRLRVALDVAATRGVRVEKGNLTDDLDRLLDQVPNGATPVVIHSATLAYLDEDDREGFLAALSDRRVHRLGAEGTDVLPSLASQLPSGLEARGRFLLSLDGAALALVGPHGGSIDWL